MNHELITWGYSILMVHFSELYSLSKHSNSGTKSLRVALCVCWNLVLVSWRPIACARLVCSNTKSVTRLLSNVSINQ